MGKHRSILVYIHIRFGFLSWKVQFLPASEKTFLAKFLLAVIIYIYGLQFDISMYVYNV